MTVKITVPSKYYKFHGDSNYSILAIVRKEVTVTCPQRCSGCKYSDCSVHRATMSKISST